LTIVAKFGKTSAEIEYRQLFENNRQINLRFMPVLFITKPNLILALWPSYWLFIWLWLLWKIRKQSGFFSQSWLRWF
jgi:hypothetical protein